MNTASLKPRCIGPQSAGVLMSPEEFDSISGCVRGHRYELIHGVLVVRGRPSPCVAAANEELNYQLRSCARQSQRPRPFDATLAERFVRTPANRWIADRAVWSGLGRRPEESRDIPTIAIEFVSAGKRNAIRDYETKRDEYLSVGVVEYWIIDRFRRALTVHRKSAKKPIVVGEFETYETKLLPGFVLHLDEIMVAADGWEPEDEENEELAS